MSNNKVAIVKNKINEPASTMVVIIGLAIIAGSSFIFLAAIGSIPPIILANITVKNKVTQTVIATFIPTLSKK